MAERENRLPKSLLLRWRDCAAVARAIEPKIVINKKHNLRTPAFFVKTIGRGMSGCARITTGLSDTSHTINTLLTVGSANTLTQTTTDQD